MHVSVGPLEKNDLPEADRIYRLAFGTFIGLSDPMTCFGDADYISTRFHADPSAAYGAKVVDDGGDSNVDDGDGGKLVGSNFTTNWGSVGFFGPLTVHPEYWGKGVAKSLLKPTMQLFSKWNTKHAGLFTFAHSPNHVSLYQKFGFWPYFLTAIMSKDVGPIMDKKTNKNKVGLKWSRYSEAYKEEELQEGDLLKACNMLTNSIYDGLDLRVEIISVIKQRLGDIVLVWDDKDGKDGDNNNKKLVGFGICHCGKGTEAGSNTCYVKFAAVNRRGAVAATAESNFQRLLDACESFASEQGLSRLVAGVNTARHQAYAKMLSNRFRIDMLGIAMQKGNDVGYNRPDVYIIDDWR
jgi:GNAT superfamily N-acetyltransferase